MCQIVVRLKPQGRRSVVRRLLGEMDLGAVLRNKSQPASADTQRDVADGIVWIKLHCLCRDLDGLGVELGYLCSRHEHAPRVRHIGVLLGQTAKVLSAGMQLHELRKELRG